MLGLNVQGDSVNSLSLIFKSGVLRYVAFYSSKKAMEHRH